MVHTYESGLVCPWMVRVGTGRRLVVRLDGLPEAEVVRGALELLAGGHRA